MLGSALIWSITVRWAVVNCAKGEASPACLLSTLVLGADTTTAIMQAMIRIVDLIVLFGIKKNHEISKLKNKLPNKFECRTILTGKLSPWLCSQY